MIIPTLAALAANASLFAKAARGLDATRRHLAAVVVTNLLWIATLITN